MKVCICGYGVVGKGVVDILDSINPNFVQKIYTREILEDRRYEDDFKKILKNKDINVVVEAMGGLHPAYEMMREALLHKKHVVTSNKALVEYKGQELLQLAKENHVQFLFEASVGGGMPLLSTLKQSLKYEPIKSIEGILNGTSNYILTKMLEEDLPYETVLKEAQDLGYAEKDPTDDVEGFDSARKIAILASLISQKKVNFESFVTQGITKISQEMIAYAKKHDYKIRLIARAIFEDEGIRLSVLPTLIDASNPFYFVDGVNNAVMIDGEFVGEVMIYGAGAGRYPTASAVVSDVMSLQNEAMNVFEIEDKEANILNSVTKVCDFNQNECLDLSDIDHKNFLAVVM